MRYVAVLGIAMLLAEATVVLRRLFRMYMPEVV